MSEVRDPHILYIGDSFAYSRRFNGFVPWTEFYTEETARHGGSKEVLWFDHRRGNGGELVEAKKPDFSPEVTDSDMYAYRHRFGVFASIPFVKRTILGDLRALLRLGYRLPSPHRVLIRAPLPVWPPMDEVELTIEERRWFMYSEEDNKVREALLEQRRRVSREISTRCPACAATSPFLVIKESNWYGHGINYSGIRKCEAHRLHCDRWTMAPVVRKPKKLNA